jgi:LemA protein
MDMSRYWIVVLGVIAFVVLVAGCSFSAYRSTHDELIDKREKVKGAWGQVNNTYQRRFDLIPNLVETVKGYAAHERGTLEAVTEARASVGRMNVNANNLEAMTPEQLAAFEKAQQSLAGALQRLLVVTENYPALKADKAFEDLRFELAGTENRITVERMRFIKATEDYNSSTQSLVANFFFGDKFPPIQYYESDDGASKAPKVDFTGGK